MAVVYVSEDAKKKLPARAEADHYPTDYWYARALVEKMREIRQEQDCRDESIGSPWLQNKTAFILDPGCGNDPVFARAMRDMFDPQRLEVWGFDIRQEAIAEARAALDVAAVCDFTGFPGMMSGYPQWDVIVGNPPYNLAEPFVRKALEVLRPAGWLGFLLPITFLASKGRAEGLYTEFPPHTILFLGNRPSFSGDGQTAPSEYIFILWKKGYNGPSFSQWFVSEEPAKVKAARLERRRAARKAAKEAAELESIPGNIPAEVCPSCRQPGNDITAFDDLNKQFACANSECDTGIWEYIDGNHKIIC